MDKREVKGRLLNNRLKTFYSDLVETFWVYSSIPYLQGKKSAQTDIRNGRTVLKTFGKPAKWRGIYADLLQNRHQIVLESVSEEQLNGKTREFIRGYNSVVKEHLTKRYGKDFLSSIIEEAREILDKQTRLRKT